MPGSAKHAAGIAACVGQVMHCSTHPSHGCAGTEAQALSQQLWLTLLQQQAWLHSPALQGRGEPAPAPRALHALQGPAQEAMAQLATACGLPDAAALSAVHARAVLDAMLQVWLQASAHAVSLSPSLRLSI